MADGSERRRHKRIAVTWTGEASKGTDAVGNVEIVNVSESGMGIVSLAPMHPGEQFVFKFAGWTELPIGGIVRWTEVGELQTYAGIQFIGATDKQRAALRTLIGRYDEEDWGG